MRNLDLPDLVALAGEVSEVEMPKLLELLETPEVSAVLADARAPLPPHAAAAALLTGLAAVAPLPAGNRRLALLAAVHMLALNGLEVTLEPPVVAELFSAGADVAALLDGRVTARDPLEGELRRLLGPDAQQSIGLALQRARRHRRQLASPGDLLMGVVGEGAGPAAKALGNHAAPVQVMTVPRRPLIPEVRRTFEPGARKALELAFRAATSLGHAKITTAHLLLGLLDAGHAAELPEGLDEADVRRRLLDLLGPRLQGEDRLAELALRLRTTDPVAAAELDELADLQRVGLDRLIELVRAWRGEVFLEALARDPLIAGLLGPDRLTGAAPDDPDAALLANYVEEVARYPRLSRAEEVDLATSTREDSRRLLIQSNLQLVVSIARRYEGRGLPLLDLIQEGNLGLMRAVEKYDPTKGYRFATFAAWWARQAIEEAVTRRHDPGETRG